MAMFPRSAALLIATAFALPLASCAGPSAMTEADTQYVARDVNTLYNLAKDQLDNGRYTIAAALFAEVERQHPYSPWARRSQIMGAFSHYLAADYTEAIETGQRFLSIHPGNRDAPYVQYLIALSHYEQIVDVTRDQSTTLEALNALNELIRRYPESVYAADARLKVDLVNDHLAGKEMEIGRFYQRRRQWLASVFRFRRVVDEYPRTTHAPEALMRLTEGYLAMGIPQEAQRAAATLGANYPGSRWYQQAYELMQEHGAGPAAD
ncbi:MAG: outer membrane protein assembly factor BamD [Sphingomonadaceae bacterium]|nr:outer membrane protein assembly factor BamD [Sphingomonadaceae bacterium]